MSICWVPPGDTNSVCAAMVSRQYYRVSSDVRAVEEKRQPPFLLLICGRNIGKMSRNRAKKPAGFYKKLHNGSADLRKMKCLSPRSKWTDRTLFSVEVSLLSLAHEISKLPSLVIKL